MLGKGEIVELKIEDLAYQGKAVAKLNGLVIFLNGGLPGDTVRAKIIKIKPNYLEADTEEVIEKSKQIDLKAEPGDKTEEGKKWQEILENLNPEDFGKYKM